MNYQELTQEEILCWYDGPLIETLRDTDGNAYIAYNDIPDNEILAQVSNDLLIKMIKNQISISECFRSGSKKWKWDTEKRDYVEIPEFNPDDLLDDKVHFEDVCYFEYDKNYLNTLENKEKMMNSIEKLKAYQDSQKIVNEVENELDKMVDAFFAEPSGERIATWFFKNLEYDGLITEGSIPKIINLCVEEVIMGEGEYYTFPVPSSIIRKYLDGDKEEAAKEFQKWHKEYWEQKKREEEEKERREEEALAKAREEEEYKRYLQLKEKFEK